MLHVSRCALTRWTLWHQPHASSSFLSKVIGKKRTATRRRHNVTSDDLSTEMMQQRAGDIKHSLSGYDSGWVGQIWCALEVLHFFYHWLKGNGRVMKMTWPEVTDIQIRDKQIVDTFVRIAYCEFQRVWVFDVSLTGSQTLKNATWDQVT